MLNCSVKRKFHLDSVKNGLQWDKAGSEEPGTTEGPILSTGKADQHLRLISLDLSSWTLTQSELSTSPVSGAMGTPSQSLVSFRESLAYALQARAKSGDP